MSGTLFVTPTLALARIIEVTVTDDTVAADLEDGRSIAVPIGWYPRLTHATLAERTNFEISGAGYGIHWPDLDEDFGVEGMLLGKKSTEGPESFGRWLAGRKKPSRMHPKISPANFRIRKKSGIELIVIPEKLGF